MPSSRVSLHDRWIERFGRWRCTYLLVSLVALLALYPYFPGDGSTEALLFSVLVSLVMLAGVFSVSRSPRQFVVAAVLFVPAMFDNWLILESRTAAAVLLISSVAFFVVMAVLVLRYVFNSDSEVADRLCGVLSVYFLMGIGFADLYRLVNLIEPNSFVSSDPTLSLTIDSTRYLYLSFVTQSTLGYGDITPRTTAAESLALLQSTTGVLYVAVLVAWLVGSIRPPEQRPDADA